MESVVERNERTLFVLKIGTIASNAVFITVRVLFNYTTLSKPVVLAYVLTTFVSLLFQVQIHLITRPIYEGGRIVNTLPDLNGEGQSVAAYMLDVCYISWAIHVLAVISDRAWVLYGVIPVYFGYFATSRKPVFEAAAGNKVKIEKQKEEEIKEIEEVPGVLGGEFGFDEVKSGHGCGSTSHHGHRFFCHDGVKLSKRYNKYV